MVRPSPFHQVIFTAFNVRIDDPFSIPVTGLSKTGESISRERGTGHMSNRFLRMLSDNSGGKHFLSLGNLQVTEDNDEVFYGLN